MKWPKVQVDAAIDAPVEKPACLLAVDDHFNRADVRSAFLRRLVTQYPTAVRQFERIFLAAIAAFKDVLTVDTAVLLGGVESQAAEWLLQGRVVSLAGKTFESHDRPLDPGFHDLDGEEPCGLRDDFNDRILTTLASADQRSSLLTFYYGCPPDSLELLWRPLGGRRPLLPAIDYGDLNSSPVPRPLLFSANPRTLELLRARIETHESVLLHGTAGCGKTYVMAQALDDLRSRFNGFWHNVTEFDTIEDVLDHIDIFLDGFRAPLGLSHDWSIAIAEGEANAEESLAEKVAKALKELDRPTVLVFDRLENALPTHKPSSHPKPRNRIIEFAKALRFALAKHKATAPHVCVVFIARDQEKPNQSLPPTSSRSRFAKLLDLKAERCLDCPHSEIDDFGNPEPLVKCIVDEGLSQSRLEAIAGQIRLLFGMVSPYKAWLLCFCVRRLVAKKQSKRIQGLLSSKNHGRYQVPDNLHWVVDSMLTREESKLLQVASAFRSFWSVRDLRFVCQRAGLNSDPLKLLKGLLADKSPFFVGLGITLPYDGWCTQKPRSQEQARYDPSDELDDASLFEMASMPARFYQQRLKADRKLADRVYEALASLMRKKIEAASPVHDPASADRGTGARTATARVHEILYYCEARLPGTAARLYADPSIGSDGRDYAFFREQGAWDRIQSLGEKILLAKTSSDDVFPIGVRYETAAMYANAMAELGDTRKAQHICKDALDGHPTDDLYLRARLVLLKAKCMQYEGKYQAAIDKIRPALEDLRRYNRAESSSAYWCCRGELGLAECLMCLGQLDEAEEHIKAALANQLRLGKRARQQGLQIMALAERQRVHLRLLRGDFNACLKIVDQVPEGADMRTRAIWHYLQALAHLEEARIAEVGEWKSPSKPSLNRHLIACENDLNEARGKMLSARPGSPKWYAAIEQASSYAHSLARRNPEVDMREAYKRFSSDSLPELGTKAPYGPWQGARALEAELTEITLPWQKALENRDIDQLEKLLFGDKPLWWGSLMPKEPYLRSRHCYDRCYYLWRLAILLSDGRRQEEPRLRKTLLRLTEWYQTGTSHLYRCGAFRAARALHLLLGEALDGHAVGLQDRLEASTWLATLGEEKTTRHDPVRILRSIVIHALAERTAQQNAADACDGDTLVTIVAKVMCRLGDSVKLYQLIENGGARPGVIPRSILATGSREAMCVLCRACWGWMGTIGGKLQPSSDDIRCYCDNLRAEFERLFVPFGFDAFDAARCQVAQDIRSLTKYLGGPPCDGPGQDFCGTRFGIGS